MVDEKILQKPEMIFKELSITPNLIVLLEP